MRPNDYCPNCKHRERGLTAYPCRCCAVAQGIAMHYEPLDGMAKGSVEKVDSLIQGVYDKAEVFHNVTVQVLTNTKTGESSIAWTRNPDVIAQWDAEEYDE